MATVRASLALYDGMTHPLQSIHRALSIVLNTFEAVQERSGRAIDVQSIQQAREELARAALAFNNIEANAQRAIHEQSDFNRNIRDGTTAADRLHGSFKRILTTVGSIASVRMGLNWVQENLRLSDIQRNAERQLQTVLRNMGAQDVELPVNVSVDLAANAQVSAQTEVVTDYAEKLAALDNQTLHNTLALDTVGALSAYEDLSANIDNRIYNNSLTLDTTGAAGVYSDWSANVDKQALDNRLSLDTAGAVKNYTAFSAEVAGKVLGNNLVLGTAGAVSAYDSFAAKAGDKTVNNGLALDTAAALDVYADLTANADNQTLHNTLALDTVGAADSYNNFAAMAADRQINFAVQAETAPAVSAFEAIKGKAAAIQSQGMYGDEAMLAGAAELATYFSDAEAVMSMMDTLSNYAAGMSLGQEVDSRQMVDYATNLGKITTGTYTAMSQKGFQFSDAQKAIIEGTATQAQLVEVLGDDYRKMSADMQTAATINQVIAESWEGMYAAMSNTPTGRIAQLKNALGDVREEMGDRLYPAVLQFVEAFRSHLPQVSGIMGGLANVCGLLIGFLTQIFTLAVTVGGTIAAGWDIIGPLIYGAATAMLFYLGATKGVALAQAIAETAIHSYHTAMSVLSIGFGILTGNTGSAAMAQATFNSALMACPITWLIMGFIAVIAVVYAVVGAINHFAGTTLSATGLICGAIATAGAFVGNIFMAGLELILGGFATIWNTIAALVNFGYNAFHDFGSAVARLFFDLVDNILSLLQTLSSAIDTIFGGSLADKVQAWRDNLSVWVDDKFGAQVEIMGKFNTADFLSDYRLEYGSAFDFGYDFGKNLADKFKLPSLEDLFPEMPTDNISDVLDGIYDNVQDVAGNTAAMHDALDMTDEDLKYLRDIAERETVNRYTTAEIVVNMGGITNQVNKMDDLDGIITHLVDGVNEAVEIAAEGVHM